MKDKVPALRKKVFVDKDFQLRFILNYSLLIIIGTLIFNLVAYFILDKNIGESLFSAHLAITRTGELILPTLIYLSITFILILGTATIFITLMVSHKISGPLFAIMRYLRMMSEGKLKFEAKLRTNDQTAVLAEVLTETANNIGGRLVTLKESTENLKKDLARLNSSITEKAAGQGDLIRAVHDLNEHVRIIEERLAFFKTE